MYTMILPADNAKLFVDQIFRIFDKDGNGSIDFKVLKYYAGENMIKMISLLQAIYALNQMIIILY